ncbi:MAG: RIP metalloprotease [Pseudomonadota bacterium]|nr:RIP metalloprotease [Pseudomonadota bacterium]
MAFLQNAIFYLLPFLFVITVIVTIHELGHFVTARAFGVAIDRFSIGFGRALLSWKDRGGVEWRIGWLPLGGYVRFAGDDNAASIPDQSDLTTLRAAIVKREGLGAEQKYLYFKPLWQRALIVAAGPAANFVLAVVLFSVAFAVFGQPVTTTRVEVVPAGAAAKAGFQSGDLLLAADGRAMRSFEDVQFYVQFRAGVPIDFTVDRAGRRLHLLARPAAAQEPSPFGGVETIGRLGLTAPVGKLQRYGPIEAVGMGVGKTLNVTATTIFYLGRIVSGQVAANQLHSFIGIAHASGAMTKQAVAMAHDAQVSWAIAIAFVLIQLGALLSVSVGLLNLLPIPVLDGGHLLFYAYEAVARRPLGARVQAAGYRVGLALLVGLMLFAAWNDLQRPRVFHFLGSLFS